MNESCIICKQIMDSALIKKKRKCCSLICTTIALSVAGKKGIEKLLQWRKDEPEKYREALILAGKRATECIATRTHRVGFAVWKENDPNGFLTHQKEAGKKGSMTLLRWRAENPNAPAFYSNMSKETHKKHPGLASKRMRETNQRLMKEDYERFIRVRKEGSRKGNETLHKKGFRSNEEKIMRTLLPQDFIWDKNFAGTRPDFRSKSRKVIIEVDGPWHRQPIGNTEHALKSFERCKKRDPRNEDIWCRLGYTFYRFRDDDIRKKFDEVKNQVRSSLENHPLPTNNQNTSAV